jgi:outer membrane protein TolC
MAAAQLDYDQAIAAYVLLTGQPRLPEPLVENPPPDLPGDIGAATLPPDHPLLASADGAVAEARAERDRVQAERRGHPLLSVGGKRARGERAENPVDALQLELSMPFGLKRQAAPELAGAERELTDRKAALHQVRREAERALRRAVLARRGADEALALAREHATLASDALALARRAFDLGELGLSALLRAQERARDARLALELRRLEQGRAIARLNQAYGVVPQ